MNDEIQKIHTAADDDWAAIEKERTGGNHSACGRGRFKRRCGG